MLDCTAGAGTAPVLLGIDALKRREGVMVTQGELARVPRLPAEEDDREGHHASRARAATATARASSRSPSWPRAASRCERLATHTFGLEDVDQAIRVLGGETDEDAIHVSLLPVGDRSAA